MSSFVYRDLARTIRVQRNEAYKERKDQRFYCPNPECDAHLYRCDADGVNSSYFRATYPKTHNHIASCKFAKGQLKNSPEQFDEESFDLKLLLEQMQARSSSKKTNENHETKETTNNNPEVNARKEIKTIKQLYDVFSSLPISDKFGKESVYGLLLDQRSAHFPIYSKGLLHEKLVEARIRKTGKHFDNNKKTIYLETEAKAKFHRKPEYHSPSDNLIQPLILELSFDNDKTYQEALASFQNFNFNKNPTLKEEMQDWLILIFGDWQYSKTNNSYNYHSCNWNEKRKDVCFSTQIKSKTQYRIEPKKRQ